MYESLSRKNTIHVAVRMVQFYGHFSFLFDLILYIPINNISVMSGRLFLG